MGGHSRTEGRIKLAQHIIENYKVVVNNMTEEEVAAVENGDEASAAEAPAGPQHMLMTDAYPGIAKLSDDNWKCEGAPNWRRVPGFPIYATGQPKKADVDKCVEQAVKKYDEQKNVLWVSLRQEPVVYVNGLPHSVRNSDDLAGHIVLNEAFEINNIENKIASEIKKAGEFTFCKDLVGDRAQEKAPEFKPESGRVDSVNTLAEVFSFATKKEAKLEFKKIPLELNAAPMEDTFDLLIRLLKGHGSAVPVIFSCQAGMARSSVASVIAGIIKEAQLEAEFNKMKGIVPDEIIDSLRSSKLHPPPPARDAKDNALMLGEFPVVMKLVAELPEAVGAKQQVDRLIDAVGPPAGVENIRETIVIDKMQYDVASDNYLPILKERIMDQIEKYFMLIVFSLYCKEVGPAGFNKTFKAWLNSTKYREMIAEGKGKLEWERKVPEEKIKDLKDLLICDAFNDNLPAVINKINQLSYKMFNDLPRGDQKCKSMRKLAGRTLIEVLPPKLSVYLEDKCGDLAKVPDFYDMVGQLSYYGKMPEIIE